MRTQLRVFYDCSNCPAWCCSYPRITVSDFDIRRLAKFIGISPREFKKRHTKKGEDDGEVVLRHRADEYFGSACKFLDPETRRCSVYLARPRVCREYPGTGRCGYYDFLMSERNRHEEDDWVATTDHRT